MAQQEQRRGVGPVTVFKHHHQRGPPADGREQLADCGMEAVALGVGIGRERRRQLPDQLPEIGQQPRQLTALAPERGA